MTRHVTLVCGPPCAGKSTWVREHAARTDLVVCFDLLARAAGSRGEHRHSHAHRAQAGTAFRRACAELATRDRTAWVLRCAPGAAERAQLAERVRADTVLVLMPPLTVALARARTAGREPHVLPAIRRWYAAYSPNPGEQVISTAPPAW